MQEELEHFSVKTFKDLLFANRISLAFHGLFSQDVLTLIGHSMKKTPDDQLLSKRLFGIVIELAQNIHHYSAQKVYSEKDKRDIGIGIVAIGETDDYHIISSGNYIVNSEVEVIRTRSEYINGLDAEALKEYYKEQRKAPQRANKPGANLGFIEMVRKSGNPIDVIIKDYDDKMSFFTLTVKINKLK